MSYVRVMEEENQSKDVDMKEVVDDQNEEKPIIECLFWIEQ